MSSTTSTPDLREISALFEMSADFVHALPYGSGHINDTYCARFDQAGDRGSAISSSGSTTTFSRTRST